MLNYKHMNKKDSVNLIKANSVVCIKTLKELGFEDTAILSTVIGLATAKLAIMVLDKRISEDMENYELIMSTIIDWFEEVKELSHGSLLNLALVKSNDYWTSAKALGQNKSETLLKLVKDYDGKIEIKNNRIVEDDDYLG